MKHVQRSVLLWYSPAQMYALVTDIASYPQFLPWCPRAEVLRAQADGVTARLTLGYRGVQHAFTTRNTHVHDAQVSMALVDGPFSTLEGQWRFAPLGRPGSDEQACRVELDMRYAFNNRPMEVLLGPVFDRVCDTLVDSFVRRAEAVHGPR